MAPVDSKLFDSIRISPTKKRRVKPGPSTKPPVDDMICSHPGCEEKATNRAPKGRGRDNDFLWFCLEHVREYNKTYNYFNGMDDDDIAKYQKDARTGHRPTWKMGVNNKGEAKKDYDPYEFMAERAERRKNKTQETPNQKGRKLLNVEKQSLEALDLDGSATKEQIKTRFKELAKKHHPDVNGGDKASEDRLREIIQAYNYLKSAGFC